MEFTLSLNPEKDNAANAATGWYSRTVNITSLDDVRNIFCHHSYSPHHWQDGYRNQANHTNTHFIVVDYDSGFSIAEAQKKFKSYNYIIITSKSHQVVKPKHEDLGKVDRFHIIFPIDHPVTDANQVKQLKYAKIFEGSDPTVYETGRFFFPSPPSAEVYINEDGENLDIEELEYNISTPVPGVKKVFNLSSISTIRNHCKPVETAFSAIENGGASGSVGHKQRLLAANIIRNTVDDEAYVKKLFGSLADYREEITLKNYRSFDSKPITCSKLQEWGLCPATCELQLDIGKKSPIAFKYRSGEGLLTNDELLKDVEAIGNLDELLKRTRVTSNPLRKKKLVERIAAESGLAKAEINQEVKKVNVVDDEKSFVINGKVHEVKAAEYIIENYNLMRYQEDFYRFESGIWALVNKEEVESIIHSEIKRWSDNHTISETINAVRREAFVSQKTVEDNTDTYVIACNNGLLDVRTAVLRSFTEQDYRFQKMKANYDPSAQCPGFLRVVDEIFAGDKDAKSKILMLQEIMGYLLIPDYTLIKKMFYFWGPKANNGKSTVLDIIQAVMGEDYIDSVPLNKLDGFMLKRLAGVHANIVGDQDAAMKVPDGVIKQLVGGRDRITADVKNKEAINFKNFARLIFAVNKLPFSQAKDAGYYTHVAVLVFNNEFVPNPLGKQKKANPEMIDGIMENELDGILNWMLEGLGRLLMNKALSIPPSSIKALEEYRVENNSVMQFVEEKCRLAAHEKVERSTLYADYAVWSNARGFSHKVNANTFYKTLETEYGITLQKSDGRRYLNGIGVNIAMFI